MYDNVFEIQETSFAESHTHTHSNLMWHYI